MKTFYRINYGRVTLREHAFDVPWLLMPVLLVIKLMRFLRLLPKSEGCSSDDPPVESLGPFEVEEASLPEEVRARFEPLIKELTALGFGQPIYHRIYHPLYFTSIYWATLAHATGRAVARIHHRIWSQRGTIVGHIHKTYLFPVLLSEMNDGSFVVTSAGRPDMLAPASVQVAYRTGASAAELWERHEHRLDQLLPCQSVSATTPAQVRALIERHHEAVRDFHLARGVFQPLDDSEQEALAERAEVAPTALPLTSVEEEVLANLERPPAQPSGWGKFILILLLSLLAFVALGFKDNMGRILWLIIPILLFHELGHYLAMRWFGYRNLRMFFIPLFGAAVTGRAYNISGWKRAVVALMGPIPGIVLGIGLGIAGLCWQQPKILQIASLMLIVNGFNLLPLMPLDGGWVLHAVLFCRHPLLDMAFRLLAILSLFALHRWIGAGLWVFALVLLLGLPAAWQIARATQRLRRRALPAPSPDDRSIPRETAQAILTELGAGRHNRLPANLLSQQVTSIFEMLNARPPGILASVGLLTVHGVGFVVAVVLSIVFLLGQRGMFVQPPPEMVAPTPHAYAKGQTQEWHGAAAPAVMSPTAVTLVATCADIPTARKQFTTLSAQLPPQATLRWFGQSLLVTLPEDREADTQQLLARLQQQTQDVSVLRKNTMVFVHLSCTLPSAERAEQLREELEPYFGLHESFVLLPPWSAAWRALPKADKERFTKARKTLVRLYHLQRQTMRSPPVKPDAVGRVMRFFLPGGREAARQQREALRQAREAEQERLVHELLAEKDTTVDHAVVKLWQEEVTLSKKLIAMHGGFGQPEGPKKAQSSIRPVTEIHSQLTQRLGTLPLVKGQAKPGTDLEAALGGSVQQNEASLSLHVFSFKRVDKGLPALAEWLAQKGCDPIRYGIVIETLDREPADEE